MSVYPCSVCLAQVDTDECDSLNWKGETFICDRCLDSPEYEREAWTTSYLKRAAVECPNKGMERDEDGYRPCECLTCIQIRREIACVWEDIEQGFIELKVGA